MTAPPQIPFNREAEEAVLGSLLINPDVYADIAAILKPEDLYIHRNRWVLEAIQRLVERRVPIDMLTLSEELESVGQLEEVGGSAYLTGLINQVPSSLNAEAYARIVAEQSARRAMIQAANQIATLAYDEKNEIENATEQAAKALEQAILPVSGTALVPLAVCLSESYDRVELLSRSDELPGVPSGISGLDLKLGNFKPAQVYTIAARPGQGKTSAQITMAHHAALLGRRTAFFSLEMSRAQLTDRLSSAGDRHQFAVDRNRQTNRGSVAKLHRRRWAHGKPAAFHRRHARHHPAADPVQVPPSADAGGQARPDLYRLPAADEAWHAYRKPHAGDRCHHPRV